MGLLFPLYLLGLAALAVPLYLHLKRRPPRERVDFSSLMFLEHARPARVRRRSRPEQVGLLLLRCLALALLAFVFCRPFWKPDGEWAADAGRHSAKVVVVDTSASMRRDGVWQEAVAAAREAIDEAGESAPLALLAFDDEPRFVSSFEQWESGSSAGRPGRVRAALETLGPGWASSDLGTALATAADALAGSGGAGEIVVVSDFQAGARLDALRTSPWPDNVSVRAVVVGDAASAAGNAAVQWMTSAAGAAAPSVRIASPPDATASEFELAWEDGGDALTAVVEPGTSRVVVVPGRDPTDPGVLRVTDGAWDGDDRLFYAPPRRVTTPLALVAPPGDLPPKADPAYFLRRALTGDGQHTFAFVGAGDGPAGWVVTGPPTAAEAEAIVGSVRSGAPALVLVSGDGMAGFLGQLFGADVSVSEAAAGPGGSRYVLLGEVAFGHPVMAMFADAAVRDFSKVRFWQRREVGMPEALGATVLASFEDGAPAWVAAPAGEGLVYLFASGWQPEESQLALSTKFVPLLYAMLEHGGAFQRAGSTLATIGDRWEAGAGATVTAPDGSAVAVGADGRARLDQPGHFKVEPADADPYVVAANLAPAESRLTAAPLTALSDLGVLMAGDAVATGGAAAGAGADEDGRASATRAESAQKLWRWALVVLIVILIVETWFAGSRRSAEADDLPADRPPEPAPTTV